MRRAAKRDDNEAAIVAALERIGATVARLSAPGVPDLIVGWRGTTTLMEVKAPLGPKGGSSHATLTPEQETWWATWRGAPPVVVRSVKDALAAIGVNVHPRRGASL